MSEIKFDKPYPNRQKRLWGKPALQRLLRHFSQKSKGSDCEHTSIIAGGRKQIPANSHRLQQQQQQFYRLGKCELETDTYPSDLPPRSHARDGGRVANETFNPALFAVPYTLPCPLTLFIAHVVNHDRRYETMLLRKSSARNPIPLVYQIQTSTPENIGTDQSCNTSSAPVPEIPGKLLSGLLNGDAAVKILDNFNAFFIISPTCQGDRVLYASENLWSSEDFEKEELFLHKKRAHGQMTDIIMEITEDGNERSLLMLFGDLPTVGGREGLVLVPLIDITNFLDALTLSDLEIEQLLLQIYSADTQGVGSKTKSGSEIMQHVINRMASSILALYKDYFTLSKSAKETGFYEISHVSPKVYVDREYVTGHLTHTPEAVISQINKLMGQSQRFSLEIKWGDVGRAKRLYCIPMLGGKYSHWLCMLVDPVHPVFWQDK
ncbi:hypothetical protein PAAG_08552 [Paracoccidioides lutzii Pb01]|uniref:Uncharacterized protein n=1 Tax=Paracoccidioides lutzii (strain ATCC MYA-826 / Pb01) TaxID=502779 RepID=C1HCR1_PARBA|nr:hypothetical protein PAAG_08552 [Paracoccidioides lutzii Pb01]EEH38825.2 hypothetical protein PAAG_08552 [Paracoccidioides lutzii Pb01]